jgi:hypothetical protein
MNLEFNEFNKTISIVNITAKEASLISLAFKTPLVVATLGKPLVDEFNKLKDKAYYYEKR